MGGSPYPVFFFTDPAHTEVYALSLHDALPISGARRRGRCSSRGRGRRSRSPRLGPWRGDRLLRPLDRKSTRLNSSHSQISYAVFCLKKKKKQDGGCHVLKIVMNGVFTLPCQVV